MMLHPLRNPGSKVTDDAGSVLCAETPHSPLASSARFLIGLMFLSWMQVGL